jgi:NTE family protein
VRVHAPPRAAGWYLDGGVRLNTPIKPALDLGVDRLVVIATSAIAPNRPTGPPPDDTPDLGDVALNILHGKLSDPLIEDLRTLADVNTFFAHGARNAQRFRRARGKNPYRQVPYLFVGPPEPGMIGRLARQVYDAHYAGLKTVRAPNLALLAQLLGATSRTHHELFSYLFFAPEFIDELIELGAQHARAWLDAPPGPGQPWQLTSLDAFRHPSS